MRRGAGARGAASSPRPAAFGDTSGSPPPAADPAGPAGSTRAVARSPSVVLGGSAAVLFIVTSWPIAGSAQTPPDVWHMEPPRASGVTMPPDAPRAFAVEAPLLGWTRPTVPWAAGPARQVGRPNPADVPVVLALFSDSPEPWVEAADVRRILFDGPADPGTFVEFYREASRGAVEPGGVVTEWVRTDVTLLEGAGDLNGHGWVGERMRDYVKQAIDLVDPAIDFGLYDNDGPDGVPNSGDDNGWIDAFVIEYTEIPGSCGGPGPWPHFGGLREDENTPGYPVDETGPDGLPLRIQAYLTEGVTDCTGGELQGPNIIAHEYGHLLGLPDVYQAVEGIEPEKRHWNIGCWGLMGAGSWGCGAGEKVNNFGPVHHSVLMKNWQGWMGLAQRVGVREDELLLLPAEVAGGGVEIPLPDGSSYLLEYRRQVGFDGDLPAEGVLLYHYDPLANERVVPPELPPAKWYHLVEADGDHALRKVEAQGGNRGVAADAFGIEGRTGPYSSAAGPVRLITHEGDPVPVTLHEISVGGGSARLVISTAETPGVMDVEPAPGVQILTESEVATVRLAGGALPYTVAVSGSDLEGATAAVDDRFVTLAGTPLLAGAVEVVLTVTDARGVVTDLVVPIPVEDLSYTLDLLVDHALTSPDPGAGVATYLDAQGNRNGMTDVGDLRSYLRRTGG